VIISILLQGLTMLPSLRWLGIVRPGAGGPTYEVARGRLHAADAALARLDRMAQLRLADQQVLDTLRQEYTDLVARTRDEVEKLDVDRPALRGEELKRVRRQLLMTEKNAVMEAFRENRLERDAYERLLADLDARLLALESA
jgi:CPA1 family monovalent cation:H+ antiporter